MATQYKVADINLAAYGRKEIEISEVEMPGLMMTVRCRKCLSFLEVGDSLLNADSNSVKSTARHSL
jgi:S-adenosylhomocysteine hydrolase